MQITSERVVRGEVTVDGPIEQVWGAWTTQAGAEAFSFVQAWTRVVLSRLKCRFEVGPIDWDNPPRLKALSEIRRVLRPGGRLVIVDLEPPARQPAKGWAAFWIGHVLGAQEMLRHSLQELVPLMQSAGFAEVAAGGVGPGWLGFARGVAK